MPAGALKADLWNYRTFTQVNFLFLPVEDEASTLLLPVKVLFFVSSPSFFCFSTNNLLAFGFRANRKVDTKVFGFCPSLSILEWNRCGPVVQS